MSHVREAMFHWVWALARGGCAALASALARHDKPWATLFQPFRLMSHVREAMFHWVWALARGGCVALAIALVCVALTGCRPSGAPDTIVYWRTLTGPAGAAQEGLVESYNASEPSLPVSVEFQGSYGDLGAKLMTAAVAGGGPDVSQLGTFEIAQFAKAGLLADLGPVVRRLNTSDWPEHLLDAGKVGDVVFWLPFNVSVPVLYYNPSALSDAGLDHAPETWDGFFDAVETMTLRDENGAVTRAGLALWNITWPLFSMVWSEGGALTDPDYANITLDDPVVVRLLERLQGLVQSGAAVIPDGASGGHRAAFANGRAAMILDSNGPLDDLVDKAVGFEPGVALYPAGRAGRIYAPGGGGLVMLARTPPEKREAAIDFMAYMLDAEQIARYALESGYTAFSTGARARATDIDADPRRRTIHDALPYVKGDFSVNQSPAVRTAFDEAFQKILIDGAPVAETLRAADREAEVGVVEER